MLRVPQSVATQLHHMQTFKHDNLKTYYFAIRLLYHEITFSGGVSARSKCPAQNKANSALPVGIEVTQKAFAYPLKYNLHPVYSRLLKVPIQV